MLLTKRVSTPSKRVLRSTLRVPLGGRRSFTIENRVSLASHRVLRSSIGGRGGEDGRFTHVKDVSTPSHRVFMAEQDVSKRSRDAYSTQTSEQKPSDHDVRM